jgi:hypothetical protein
MREMFSSDSPVKQPHHSNGRLNPELNPKNPGQFIFSLCALPLFALRATAGMAQLFHVIRIVRLRVIFLTGK